MQLAHESAICAHHVDFFNCTPTPVEPHSQPTQHFNTFQAGKSVAIMLIPATGPESRQTFELATIGKSAPAAT